MTAAGDSRLGQASRACSTEGSDRRRGPQRHRSSGWVQRPGERLVARLQPGRPFSAAGRHEADSQRGGWSAEALLCLCQVLAIRQVGCSYAVLGSTCMETFQACFVEQVMCFTSSLAIVCRFGWQTVPVDPGASDPGVQGLMHRRSQTYAIIRH